MDGVCVVRVLDAIVGRAGAWVGGWESDRLDRMGPPYHGISLVAPLALLDRYPVWWVYTVN